MRATKAVLVYLLALAYACWMLLAASAWVGKTIPGFMVYRTGHVTALHRMHWNGMRAGLRTGDHVVAIDGRPVATGAEIYRYVQARPAGTAFTFTFERHAGPGKPTRLALTARSQPLSPADWVATALPLWAMGAACILLGILVAVVRPGDAAARAHLCFCLTAGLLFTSVFNFGTDVSLRGIPIDLGAALQPFAAVAVALVLPRRSRWLAGRAWPNYALAAGGVAFVLVNLYLDLALDLSYVSHILCASSAYVGYLAMVVAAARARWGGDSSPRERSQGTTILVGALFGLVPALASHLAKLAGFVVPGGDYSDLPFLVFPVAIAYAIVRHQLFEIELIVKRTITYALATGLLVAGYFALAAGLGALIGRQGLLSHVLATAAIAVGFTPLRDWLQRRVDRTFFRPRYDFDTLTTGFGELARELHEPEQLFQAFFDHAERALHPAYMAVLAPEAEAPLARVGEPAPAGLPGALTFPLIGNGALLGTVVVGPQKSDRAFGGQDRLLLVNLAQTLAGALHNCRTLAELARRATELARVNQEMEIAASIQAALLPGAPSREGFDIALEQLVAAEVGGDLIDYVAIDAERFWLAVGDVTGHGLTPGLVMMMAQSMFTSLATNQPDLSPGELLARINRPLYENVKHRLKRDTFMTLQLLRHDGQGRFVAAGLHCDILVFRARTGRVERVQTAGLWTGLVPDVRTWSEDRAFQLEPGDVMLLYTDGLIEAMNGRREQFDVPRLEAALARLHHLEAAELTRGIMADVRAWLVDQADDITLLALKRLPVAAPLPSPVPSR